MHFSGVSIQYSGTLWRLYAITICMFSNSIDICNQRDTTIPHQGSARKDTNFSERWVHRFHNDLFGASNIVHQQSEFAPLGSQDQNILDTLRISIGRRVCGEDRQLGLRTKRRLAPESFAESDDRQEHIAQSKQFRIVRVFDKTFTAWMQAHDLFKTTLWNCETFFPDRYNQTGYDRQCEGNP